jgi:transposase
MHYTIDLRQKVIAAIKRGHSKAEVAHMFGINRQTITNWLSRGDDLAPRLAKTRKRKLVKAEALKLMAERDDARLIDYAEKLGVSHVAVWHAFKRWGITKKNDPVRGTKVYIAD